MTPSEPDKTRWLRQLDELIEESAPPVVDISAVQVSRNSTPLERVAGWFLNGAPPVLLALLLFVGLNLLAVDPSEVCRLLFLAIGLTWLLVPLLGRFPSSSPGRSVGVGLLGLFTGSLLLWPTFVLFSDRSLLSSPPPDHGFMFQNSLEHSFRPGVFGLSLLLLVSGVMFSVWARKRYPWLATEYPRQKWRVGLAVTAVVGPLALSTIYLSYLSWQVQSLDWVGAAAQHDPFEGTSGVEGFSLDAFAKLNGLDFGERQSVARDLTPEQLENGLRKLFDQFSDSDFIPSNEDQTVLSALADRIVVKDQPTRASGRFALELLKLTNQTRGEMEIAQLEQLISDHAVPNLGQADSEELKWWRREVDSIRPFQPSVADFDALVWRTIQERSDLLRQEKPLELFGVRVAPNLGFVVHEWLSKTLLLDYTRRRALLPNSPADGGHLGEDIAENGSEYLFWPDDFINSFYKAVSWRLDPRPVQRSHKLLGLVLDLREYKLEFGQYPEELQGTGDFEYERTAQGAVLRLNGAEGSGQWVLP